MSTPNPSFTRSDPSSPTRNPFLLKSIFTLILLPTLAIVLEIGSHQHPTPSTLKHTLLNSTKLITLFNHPPSLPSPPYTLYSSQVVLPTHTISPAYIIIGPTGKIQNVVRFLHPQIFLSAPVLVDVSPLVIMPGLIDPHVHVNEPGRTTWEGFEHATRAAAAGGTTTILDMPLNNRPSTLDNNTLQQKIRALQQARPSIDVGLIGGVTPNNMQHVEELVDAGVVALKSFMVDSQSPDFVHVQREDLKEAIGILHQLASEKYPHAPLIPYMLHAEMDIGPDDRVKDVCNHKSYADYEATRPASWEVEAVQYAVETANNSRVHVYIVHVSAHLVIDYVSRLRQAGDLKVASLTVETCPHYLLWASDEIADGETIYKCSPPIRAASNRDQLLSSIFQDAGSNPVVDVIASDHSPCPYDLKQTNGNLTNAWGGIAGLQYRLQGSWTAARASGATVVNIVQMLAEGPARTFGLGELKGFLKEGLDADIVIWDPEAEENLAEESCQHRGKASPYHGMIVRGQVVHTLLRGRAVFSRGDWKSGDEGDEGLGRLIQRSPEDGRIVAVENLQ